MPGILGTSIKPRETNSCQTSATQGGLRAVRRLVLPPRGRCSASFSGVSLGESGPGDVQGENKRATLKWVVDEPISGEFNRRLSM